MRSYLTSITVAVLMIALVPAGAFAQTGKIESTVTDAQTKEPLVGANVVLEGRTLFHRKHPGGKMHRCCHDDRLQKRAQRSESGKKWADFTSHLTWITGGGMVQ